MNVDSQNYDLTSKEYNHLYCRFLRKTPQKLLDIFDIKCDGKIIWDFCCGANMRASNHFLSSNAKECVSVDNYKFNYEAKENQKVYQNGVNDFLFHEYLEKKHSSPDLIFCQQGISYIFNENLLYNISFNFLKDKDSSFIFNLPKYSEELVGKMTHPNIHTKFYDINGEPYIENNWISDFENLGKNYFENVPVISHLQWCSSVGHHFTNFYYLDHNKICLHLREKAIMYHIKELGNSVYFQVFGQ